MIALDIKLINYVFMNIDYFTLDTCLLSIERAFLPNSKANPKVNTRKKTSIIIKPKIPLTYALTT